MASLTSELLDRVSCGVCMNQYDNNTHVPKLLPCQHTFCQSCLTSIGAETVDIICPGCRKKHKVPRNGFTTNRAILDVVDELMKDATSCVLMCAKHTSKESVSVCVDCLEGLCSKCLKATRHFSNHHYFHRLEELDDAKIQLRKKFESQAKEKRVNLQKKITRIKQSAYSLAQIVKAESDINKMCDKIETVVVNWKEAQLAKVAGFKEAAAKREDTIQAEAENLQSLLQQEDIGIRTLISELKQEQSQSTKHLKDLFEENQYTFAERCKELVASYVLNLILKNQLQVTFSGQDKLEIGPLP